MKAVAAVSCGALAAPLFVSPLTQQVSAPRSAPTASAAQTSARKASTGAAVPLVGFGFVGAAALSAASHGRTRQSAAVSTAAFDPTKELGVQAPVQFWDLVPSWQHMVWACPCFAATRMALGMRSRGAWRGRPSSARRRILRPSWPIASRFTRLSCRSAGASAAGARPEELIPRPLCPRGGAASANLNCIGYIVPEYFRFPGYLSPSQGIKFADVPSGFAAFSKVPLEGWAQIVIFAGMMEARFTENEKAPGDFGFGNLGALGLFGPVKDPAERTRKLNAEIANGRLAMFAIMALFFQNGVTGSTGSELYGFGDFSDVLYLKLWVPTALAFAYAGEVFRAGPDEKFLKYFPRKDYFGKNKRI